MGGFLGRLAAKLLEKVGLRTIAKVGAEETAEQVVKEGAEQAAKAAATHATENFVVDTMQTAGKAAVEEGAEKAAASGAGKGAAEAAEKATGAGVNNTFHFHGPNASVSTGNVTQAAASEAPKTGFLNWAKSKIGWKTATTGTTVGAGGVLLYKTKNSNPLNGASEGASDIFKKIQKTFSDAGEKLGGMGFGMGSVAVGVGLAALGALIPGGGLVIAAVLGIIGLIAGQGVVDAALHAAETPKNVPENVPAANKPAATTAAPEVEVTAPAPTPPVQPAKANAPVVQR